jgi:hypothetical protein
MQYRKKPVVVEALQWLGHNREEMKVFVQPSDRAFVCDVDTLMISTLEGDMTALVGDWIIKGIKGEFYPCKPDIFEATYEAV